MAAEKFSQVIFSGNSSKNQPIDANLFSKKIPYRTMRRSYKYYKNPSKSKRYKTSQLNPFDTPSDLLDKFTDEIKFDKTEVRLYKLFVKTMSVPLLTAQEYAVTKHHSVKNNGGRSSITQSHLNFKINI
ncbi:hypothetical protein BpHYR1_011600 [Brachionus plicatilis]|uniref:Uncharacterized protein n=1 Tax=Brachionus plicatilis TaxID=10195 RepID=A0A3M7S322_BRAPC|nr:hypothetical protein BpHYR1_011600 [Brachionus plicatilis]